MPDKSAQAETYLRDHCPNGCAGLEAAAVARFLDIGIVRPLAGEVNANQLPFMITRQMQIDLGAMGITDDEINHMTPNAAHEKLEMLNAALSYAARGWAIVPMHSVNDGRCTCNRDDCAHPGNHPRISAWQEQATTDPAAIRAWWTTWPSANIGIHLGKSGLVCTDIDRHDGIDGFKSFSDLLDHTKFDTCTIAEFTPNSGQHQFYKGEALPKTSYTVAPGVEILSGNHCVTVCPSKRGDRVYRWIDTIGPDDIDPLPFPQVLIDLVTAPKLAEPTTLPTKPLSNERTDHYARAALIAERDKVAFALKGERNDTLNKSAFALGQLVGAGALDRGEVEAELLHAAVLAGLSESEARATIKSGLDKGIAEPRQLPERSTPNTTTTTTKTPAQSVNHLCTDLGNGQRFADRHADHVRYTEHLGWLAYDGQRWERDESGRVSQFAKETALSVFDEARAATSEINHAIEAVKTATEHADETAIEKMKAAQAKAEKHVKGLTTWAMQSQHSARLDAMIKQAKSERGVVAHYKDFDAYPMLLNVQNGTLDLRTATLRPHQAGDLLTKIAGTHYDATATCPTWLAFLDRIFAGDADVIRFAQRYTGYSLTGDTSEQCLAFLHGLGDNGKTTLTNAVVELLGDYATRTPTETLMLKQYAGIPNDIARLAGARAVIASELTDRRLNESLVKDLTGQDVVVGRYLHHEFFEYRPQFKLWMYGNHKPSIRGTDTGIWRRIRLIPFNVTIPPDEKDAHLPDKLRAELPGILTWAVLGCLEWQRDGLRTPEAVKRATESYREEMDTLGEWLAECCTQEQDATATAKDLLESYRNWSGESKTTSKWLAKELRERGFTSDRLGHGGTRVWCGIGLIMATETTDDIDEAMVTHGDR